MLINHTVRGMFWWINSLALNVRYSCHAVWWS